MSTCNTCQRIIGELNGLEGFEFVDVKLNNIQEDVLDMLADKKGSYEALFNRRAQKYRSMELASKALTESDYRRLILEEYTFLKRPVLIMGTDVFVGNSKKEVQRAKQVISG